MTFPLKSYTFIDYAIKRIVEYIKANAKKQCFFVNLTNKTFWKDTPRGQEILEFFKRMTDSQKIEFLGLFDIFVVGFHNGINAFISMTANPSNHKFEHTVFISISKGYNKFKECCPLRQTTPSIDLRSEIGHSESPFEQFGERALSPSLHGSIFPSVERTFGRGPANAQYSPFQEQGPWSFGGGPVSNFSLFSSQPPAIGGNVMGSYLMPEPHHGTPVYSPFAVNPFTLQADFVPLSSATEPLSREGILKIKKGRVIREIQIPSGCSSGPSTSSTVRGINKNSPKTQTPIETTIANLEKKIARLESGNPIEGSLSRLELQLARAKLEKMRNSL